LTQSSSVLQSWVTLLDLPNDDAFDGILGEDDEESPRVLINVAAHTIESVSATESGTSETDLSAASSPLKTLKLDSSIQNIRTAEPQEMLF